MSCISISAYSWTWIHLLQDWFTVIVLTAIAAQLLEHLTCRQEVIGLSLTLGTQFFWTLWHWCVNMVMISEVTVLCMCFCEFMCLYPEKGSMPHDQFMIVYINWMGSSGGRASDWQAAGRECKSHFGHAIFLIFSFLTCFQKLISTLLEKDTCRCATLTKIKWWISTYIKTQPKKFQRTSLCHFHYCMFQHRCNDEQLI